MEQKTVFVRMLGDFVLSSGEVAINGTENRSRKIWLLTSYLIYNRERVVPQEELIHLLGGEDNTNASGALKTILWRARRILEPLQEELGTELIVSRKGGYRWNDELNTVLDVELFEEYCAMAEKASGDKQLALVRKALEQYNGEFLSRLAGEFWIEPISVYHQNQFLDAALMALPLMKEAGERQEAVALCRRAIRVFPYEEELYRYLLINLNAQEKYEESIAAYEELRTLLLDQLGVIPGEELQVIYREAARHAGSGYLPPEMIRSQLREQNPANGAMICDYASFRLFYQAEARSAARRGDAIHIGVLSVVSKDEEKELSTRVLHHAMDQLQTQIHNSLRMGDVASCCSASQYILLLVQANYENSEMVCRRVVAGFAREHPRSPVRIQSNVLPLEPLLELS